jgi:ABC-type glycerol-3-phosphate transport system permease component
MRRLLPWAVVLVLSGFALFPLAWIVFSSLKSYADLYRFPPSYAPESLSLGFYAKVLETTPFTTFMLNSVIVGIAATLAGVAVAAMAGYALARARFRGRGLLLKAVLLAYMFPQILIVVPLFAAIARVGLANTYLGLVLAYVTYAFPFATWMLTAYFEKIPLEIEEAGRIDGASNFRVFWRLVLPLAAPGVVTVAIFCFINAWNEFLYALVILGGGERRTLPVGLYSFVGGEFAQWGEMMAATAMTMVPTLVLFMLIQKRLAGGLTAGAVRG